MRALSVFQPWASLLVLGRKRFETRSWRTTHRGLLAIHAARKFSATVRALCLQEPFRSLLREAGIENADALPRGVVLGTAELVGCTLADELSDIPDAERQFGNFGPGRWAWQLAAAAPLPSPVPARGRLGIFELPIALP
jgi:hypothetical protein